MYEELNEELRCDVCGMSYSEFLKTGIFGCHNCYIVFKQKTVEIIKNEIKCNGKNPIITIKSKKPDSKPKFRNVHIKIKQLRKLLSTYEMEKDFEMIDKIKKEIEKYEKIEIEY